MEKIELNISRKFRKNPTKKSFLENHFVSREDQAPPNLDLNIVNDVDGSAFKGLALLSLV